MDLDELSSKHIDDFPGFWDWMQETGELAWRSAMH